MAATLIIWVVSSESIQGVRTPDVTLPYRHKLCRIVGDSTVSRVGTDNSGVRNPARPPEMWSGRHPAVTHIVQCSNLSLVQ